MYPVRQKWKGLYAIISINDYVTDVSSSTELKAFAFTNKAKHRKAEVKKYNTLGTNVLFTSPPISSNFLAQYHNWNCTGLDLKIL